MRPLKDVIACLRREIEEGLGGSRSTRPEGVRIEANRVVLQLAVTVSEIRASKVETRLEFGVESSSKARTSKGAPPVMVTVEFQILGSGVGESSRGALAPSLSARDSRPIAQGSATSSIREESKPGLIESLSRVFGPPGFDSSARSTVFCETLEGLSSEQILTVIESLDGAPRAGLEAGIKRARHLLNGVLRSGPLRSAKEGGPVLVEVFRHFESDSLVRLIRETWRSQEHWMGTI